MKIQKIDGLMQQRESIILIVMTSGRNKGKNRDIKKRKRMSFKTEIRNRLLLITVIIVNRFRVRNRFNAKVSLDRMRIIHFLILEFTMTLFIVKERTKRNRIRIDTQIIRIENALINTLLNRLSNNLK